MDHRPGCDILIVGAGSAGCILANQLAGRHGFRVTLIEPPTRQASAALRDRPANWIRLPGGVEDWDFPTQPDPNLAGRSLRWPRGRGIGGSSRINAMIWAEPTASDIGRWLAASGEKWKPEDIRNAVRQVRDLVRPESPRWISESSKRFLLAAEEFEQGAPIVYERVNRQGRRWNPADLLRDIPNNRLSIIRAHVDRIAFDGDRAIGVVVNTSSTREVLRCEKKIVLCAGSIASPTILMRSGIGPPGPLRELGIEPRVELSGVGENLRDHLIMPVVFGIGEQNRFPTRCGMRDIANWQILGGGPLASNLAECGGLFLDERLQLHVTPTHYLTHPSARSIAAMTIGVNPVAPQSAGRLSLSSKHASDPPKIEPNYLTEDDDLQMTVEGVRLARQLASGAPLGDWITGELLPGPKRDEDASIAKSVGRYAQTLYHPIGTCAIGSVVDSALCVGQTENVSIVDASVLPTLTTRNPSASVMTIAMWFAQNVFDG